jgi:endonuclease/exonuclease/phosphatase (EEP) superfamily protein YafD
MAGAAGVLVAAHLAFILPELVASEPVPSAARAAPHLRIFSGNVFVSNDNVRGYAEEIRQARPDIVVLQESTPAFLGALDATGVLGDLPHRVVVSRSDPFAAAVISRWPLREDDVVAVRGRPVLIRMTVDAGSVPAPVRLFAFHSVGPVSGLRQEWIEDLHALGRAVSAEKRPVLVAGDFNATWGNRAFRSLLDRGLTDAAAARGNALQMTWPRNVRIIPPALRIDHILTTDGLAVTHIVTGTGSGSDHRPLVADVAVL